MMLNKALSNSLNRHKNIQHGFYGSEGGVSTETYHSLNIANYVGDDPKHVLQNRQRIADDCNEPIDHLCQLTQIHGNDVLTITKPLPDTLSKGDAMVTDRPNIVLGIQTADCAPILFSDPINNIIGAAHAGWKGALGQIGRHTIDAMCALGADKNHITAAIGPCIQQPHYEVDQNFFIKFCDQHENAEQFFMSSTRLDHYLFDLSGFVKHDLKQYGIDQVDALQIDTYPNDSPYFSHRYNTHHNLGMGGRQISAICLKKP